MEIQASAANKDLLGYHDIRLGSEPDARLKKFLCENLPKLIEPAQSRFEDFRDLSAQYANGAMAYKEFAARVRRRCSGTPEDSDWET